MEYLDTLMMPLPPSPLPPIMVFPEPEPDSEENLQVPDLNFGPKETGPVSVNEECYTSTSLHPACANCCVEFMDSPLEEKEGECLQNFKNNSFAVEKDCGERYRVYEIFENPFENQNMRVSDILSSIYKLNYLNDLETTGADAVSNRNQIPLCLRCAEALSSLYKAFEYFNKLRNLDSYIARKLSQLEQLISDLTYSSNLDVTSTETDSLDPGRPNPSQSQSREVERVEFQTEIHPASIKIELDTENISNYPSPSSSTSPSSATGELITTHSHSGPPWVYLRKLRSTDLNSFSNSNHGTSASSSACLSSRKRRRICMKRTTNEFEDSSSFLNADINLSDDDGNFDYDSVPDSEKLKAGKKLKLKKAVNTPPKSRVISKTGKKRTVDTKKWNLDVENLGSISGPAFSKPTVVNTNTNYEHNSCELIQDGSETGDFGLNNDVTNEQLDSNIKSEGNPLVSVSFRTKERQKFANKQTRQRKRDRSKGSVYLAHFLRKKSVPCPCWYCLKDFQTEPERSDHVRDSHVKKSSKIKYTVCDPCGKIFQGLSPLKVHLPKCGQPPHGMRLPPYICTYCSKEFHDSRSLQAHEKVVHLTQRTVPCPHEDCLYLAKTPKQLEQHIRNKHRESDNFPCNICKTMYKSNYHYKLHYERMHTEEGRRKYDIINKKAALRDKEMRKKRALTSFVCQECKIDFQTKVRLTRHNLAEHIKEKKYICEQCGKGFIESYRLKKHILFTHTEERPYICDQCGKSFKSIFNLNSHIQTTHDEEGRRKYNEYMRENNRKRMAIAKQVALASMGNSSPNNSSSNNLLPPEETGLQF